MAFILNGKTAFDPFIELYDDKYQAMINGDRAPDTIWFALQGAMNKQALAVPIKPMEKAAFLQKAARAYNDMQDAFKINRDDLINKAKDRCIAAIKGFHELFAD